MRNGAREIDMVINIGALKSKDYALVLQDIRGVVEAAGQIPVKVILETSKLNRDEKVIACALSKAACAAFVKTSTGFGGGGATPEDVELMRAVVGDDMGVKASGGVRSIDDAELHAAYDLARCVGCGQCYIICQDAGSQCLRWDEEKRQPITDSQTCFGCMICSFVCPVDELIAYQESTPPK